MEDHGERTDAPGYYVRLGWLINKHFPGYVDAYFGPTELCAAVEAEQELLLEDLEIRHVTVT